MASEYGLTFDQIQLMTMRQIDVALKYISKRQHNAYAMRAALVGVKIPLKESYSRVDVSRTEEDNQRAEQMIKESQERIRREIQARGRQ